MRPDSVSGRVTIGRAGGTRFALPATLFDLGAASFVASGSVPPLLFGLLAHPPQFRHSCALAGVS